MDERQEARDKWVTGFDAKAHTPKDGEELTGCDQCDALMWVAIDTEQLALCADCSTKKSAALRRAAQKGFHFGL